MKLETVWHTKQQLSGCKINCKETKYFKFEMKGSGFTRPNWSLTNCIQQLICVLKLESFSKLLFRIKDMGNVRVAL